MDKDNLSMCVYTIHTHTHKYSDLKLEGHLNFAVTAMKGDVVLVGIKDKWK